MHPLIGRQVLPTLFCGQTLFLSDESVLYVDGSYFVDNIFFHPGVSPQDI